MDVQANLLDRVSVLFVAVAVCINSFNVFESKKRIVELDSQQTGQFSSLRGDVDSVLDGLNNVKHSPQKESETVLDRLLVNSIATKHERSFWQSVVADYPQVKDLKIEDAQFAVWHRIYVDTKSCQQEVRTLKNKMNEKGPGNE
jgi:hypothetical protein